MKKFQIWSSGFVVTGMSSKATLMGVIEAASFDEACATLRDQTTDLYSRSCFHRHADGRWSYWSCWLYDNEGDARVGYG